MKDGNDLTARGARKLTEWLRECRALGWSGEAIAGPLYDLWIKYHDRDGNMIDTAVTDTEVRT